MNMKFAARFIFQVSLVAALLILAAGCAQLSVQGGEKPIHMIVDVNIKVDKELDQFFAFEKVVRFQDRLCAFEFLVREIRR